MDTFIISKISDYLPASKNYELAKSVKNSALTKILLEKCLSSAAYVIYINGDRMRTISVPIMKEKTDYPKLNYADMTVKYIKNAAFFYSVKSRVIHSFQYSPALYTVLNIDEDIEETCFYEIDDYSFLLNINHSHIYEYKRLKRVKKYTLATGFFFEETLFDNYFYSEFFGEEIIVQHLASNETFRLKLNCNTYYDFISREYILIDFAFAENPISGVLPNNNLTKEERKNCLFKYHLLSGTPNKISLEFVSFLPKDYKFQKFCFNKGFYWARVDEEKCVSIWQNTKENYKIKISDMDKIIDIDQIDNQRLIVEYEQELAIIDFDSGLMSSKIDMTKKIKGLRSLGTIRKVGNYFIIVCLLHVEKLGGWREYVLDQNFNIVYEIEQEEVFKNYVFSY